MLIAIKQYNHQFPKRKKTKSKCLAAIITTQKEDDEKEEKKTDDDVVIAKFFSSTFTIVWWKVNYIQIEYNSNKCQKMIAAAFQWSYNNYTCDGQTYRQTDSQSEKEIADFNDKNNNNHSGMS